VPPTPTWSIALGVATCRSAYQNGIAAIITAHRTVEALSNSLNIANVDFFKEPRDGITFGNNNAAYTWVKTDLPVDAESLWARIWQLGLNDQGSNDGTVTQTFDISDAGGQGSFESAGYTLLKGDTPGSGQFYSVVGNSSFNSDRSRLAV
jgi:hypothetical protein